MQCWTQGGSNGTKEADTCPPNPAHQNRCPLKWLRHPFPAISFPQDASAVAHPVDFGAPCYAWCPPPPDIGPLRRCVSPSPGHKYWIRLWQTHFCLSSGPCSRLAGGGKGACRYSGRVPWEFQPTDPGAVMPPPLHPARGWPPSETHYKHRDGASDFQFRRTLPTPSTRPSDRNAVCDCTATFW